MSNVGTPLPVGSIVPPGTLRARMEELRATGAVFTLKQAVGVMVPLGVAIADRHAAGQSLYVHPSSIVADAYGRWQVAPDLALQPPSLPRDKACMAPEERAGRPGNARSSVYAVGAMLYELVTGLSVGPGMRRPTEVVPTLPESLEIVLSKALVADPAHRPDDLKALAQAIHHLAPSGSIPPPAADESHLDHDDNFDVDVSLSMLPPPNAGGKLGQQLAANVNPYDLRISQAQNEPRRDSTNELTQLKARLEADPRPRYVVIKDGMDHGPFNAVEVLQQIASHAFVEADALRDAFSKDERPIKDWEEFAPFAEHARLHRDITAEKQAIEHVVKQEQKSTRGKAVFVTIGFGAVLAAAAVWFLTTRGAKSDDIAVQGEISTNIETDSGLNVPGGRGRGGGRGGGVVGTSPGGQPILSGGMSCEGAQAKYVEEYNIGGGAKVAPDLTAGAYGNVLNRGTYFGHCGVPDNTSVSICAAVQNGHAVGVSVSTSPSNPGISSCVSRAVRGLSFPSHPRLDVTRTTFAAQ